MQDQEDAFASLSLQEPAVMDSPLTGEALLSRPAEPEMAQTNKAPTSFNHSLAALLNGYESEAEETTPLVAAPVVEESAPVRAPTPLGLRAGFIIDVTLPDGQNFPPGAEFMKCWKMANSGGVPWPAETELVYVAGEPLAREHGGPQNVVVGSLEVGEELDLWTGELKAPETPGRYVSYWRLRDGQGNLFGESIWIEYVYFVFQVVFFFC
jgi:next-to-BRCA1 protein 1